MRKMIVLALAALWMAPAFAEPSPPPQSATMAVTVTVDSYVTVASSGSLSVQITEPGEVTDNTGTAKFTVNTNCNVLATIGDAADAIKCNFGTTETPIWKTFLFNNGGTDLTWDVYTHNRAATPVWGTHTVNIDKGAAEFEMPVRLTAATGSTWQNAWAGVYGGTVTCKVTAR